jgi:Tfp pilus assembly protein PilF
MLHKTAIICCLLLLALTGCATSTDSVPSNYETVKVNPRRDTEAARLLNQNGVEALAKGKFDKAEKFFKDSLAKDVDFGPAHNNLGRLYFDQGKNYLAAWEFEYAIKVMPKRGEPYNNFDVTRNCTHFEFALHGPHWLRYQYGHGFQQL